MHKYLSFKEYTVLFNITFFVLLSSCATNGLRIEEGHYEVGQQQIAATLKLDFVYLIGLSKDEIVNDLELEFGKFKNFNLKDRDSTQQFTFNEQVSMAINRNEKAEKLKMAYTALCLIYCESVSKIVWIKLSITKGEKIVYEIEQEDTITYRQSIFLLPGVLLLPFENYPKKVILNLHKRVLEQSLLDQKKWLE